MNPISGRALLRRPIFIPLVLLLGAGQVSAQATGVQTFEISSADEPTITARAWYPAVGGEPETLGASRIRPGYEAIPEAVPSLEPHAPLVILVHGSGGSADSMAWLAQGIVNRLGALVVAANHPGSSGGDPERLSILEVWRQPQDVTRLIDDVLAGDWSTTLDENRIYVAGFSLGGTAALSLAGARLHFERFPAFCQRHDDGACRAFRPHFENLDDAFFERSNADLSDHRVRRSVAIAPGFTESLDSDALENLSTPVLMIAGSADQQLPPDTHMQPIRGHVPEHSRIVEVDGAQHFSFLPICRDDAGKILAETNEEFVCQEFGDKTRREIHAETLDLIVAFLTS